MEKYNWLDPKSDGTKNPRANRKKKLTDAEWFERLELRNNGEFRDTFGQRFTEDYDPEDGMV